MTTKFSHLVPFNWTAARLISRTYIRIWNPRCCLDYRRIDFVQPCVALKRTDLLVLILRDREADSSRRGITRFIDLGWSLPVSRMPDGCCWNSWAMTWVSDGLSRRPFGVDTLKEVQIIKPAEDGPYSPTPTHGLMQNATHVIPVTNKLCRWFFLIKKPHHATRWSRDHGEAW